MATVARADWASGRPAGFRAVQRRIAEALDMARLAGDDGGPTLEGGRPTQLEPPRLVNADIVESDRMAAHAVGEAEVGFAAFLDGVQASRIVAHHETVPIVHGSIGAVVRERIDRRLRTWRHALEERLYAPRAFLPGGADEALLGTGLIVADTTPRKDGIPDESARHPLLLADVAVSAVQAHREALELSIAEGWLMERHEPLYMDGGISGSGRVAGSAHAIGVIKSHRTLYGDASAVRLILGLEAGQRSSVFAVTSPNGWRASVASWYLRVREAADPLWGLVRVEASLLPDSSARAAGARADQVSRWILAEAAPLALPDARWDTMAYGIRDCVQFLKAILP